LVGNQLGFVGEGKRGQVADGDAFLRQVQLPEFFLVERIGPQHVLHHERQVRFLMP